MGAAGGQSAHLGPGRPPRSLLLLLLRLLLLVGVPGAARAQGTEFHELCRWVARRGAAGPVGGRGARGGPGSPGRLRAAFPLGQGKVACVVAEEERRGSCARAGTREALGPGAGSWGCCPASLSPGGFLCGRPALPGASG